MAENRVPQDSMVCHQFPSWICHLGSIHHSQTHPNPKYHPIYICLQHLIDPIEQPQKSDVATWGGCHGGYPWLPLNHPFGCSKIKPTMNLGVPFMETSSFVGFYHGGTPIPRCFTMVPLDLGRILLDHMPNVVLEALGLSRKLDPGWLTTTWICGSPEITPISLP